MPITPREQEIIAVLKEDPLISQEELAKLLNTTRSSVAVHLSNLMKKGIIAGKGYIIRDNPTVVVVGGINMDIKGHTLSGPILHTSNPGRTTTASGGVARNIAENLALLNVPTTLVGIVGQDALGDRVLAETKAAGVDIAQVEKFPGETGTYTALLDQHGELLIALAAMDILEQLTPQFLKRKEEILLSARFVICDTNIPENTLEYLITLTQQNDIPLIIEPVSTPKVEKLKKVLNRSQHDVFLITPNQEEAEILSGEKINTDESLIDVCQILHSQGIQNVLITLGERGAYLSSASHACLIPSSPVNIKDVTGAGDAFVAGIIYGLIAGHPLDKSCQFGHAAAMYTLQTDSTVYPNLSPALLEQAVSKLSK